MLGVHMWHGQRCVHLGHSGVNLSLRYLRKPCACWSSCMSQVLWSCQGHCVSEYVCCVRNVKAIMNKLMNRVGRIKQVANCSEAGNMEQPRTECMHQRGDWVLMLHEGVHACMQLPLQAATCRSSSMQSQAL